MKRILITAVAGAAALFGGVAVAAPAMASTGPTGSVACTAANSGALSGTTINKNLDVPAGSYCDLQWAHVTGNVSVEGQLRAISDTIDRNVSVNGGTFNTNNGPTHVKGNFSITNSPGNWDGSGGTNGFFNDAGTSQIDGNFNYINNSGRLYVGYPLNVSGSFTYAGNTGPAPDLSGLTVQGSSSIS